MEKFVIKTDDEKMSSINRTIRIKPETFEKITELSKEMDVSFNKIANQCLEYALRNLDEGKDDDDGGVG